MPGLGWVEVIGPRNSGKSWIGAAVAAEGLNAGRRVVMVRAEGRRKNLRERLHTFGISPDVVLDDDRFRSVPRPHIDAFLTHHGGWADGGVVVIDPAEATGATTNDAEEARLWADRTVRQFLDRCETTLIVVIDHTARRIGDDVLTIDSRGSTVKTAGSDYTLFCDGFTGTGKNLRKTVWTRDRDGHLHLVVAKGDRAGAFDTDEADSNRICTVRGYHDMALGGELRIAFDPPDKPDKHTGNKFDGDPLVLVLDLIRDHEADTGIGANTLDTMATKAGLTQNAARAHRRLAVEQHLAEVTVGDNGAHLHRLTPHGLARLDPRKVIQLVPDEPPKEPL